MLSIHIGITEYIQKTTNEIEVHFSLHYTYFNGEKKIHFHIADIIWPTVHRHIHTYFHPKCNLWYSKSSVNIQSNDEGETGRHTPIKDSAHFSTRVQLARWVTSTNNHVIFAAPIRKYNISRGCVKLNLLDFKCFSV